MQAAKPIKTRMSPQLYVRPMPQPTLRLRVVTRRRVARRSTAPGRCWRSRATRCGSTRQAIDPRVARGAAGVARQGCFAGPLRWPIHCCPPQPLHPIDLSRLSNSSSGRSALGKWISILGSCCNGDGGFLRPALPGSQECPDQRSGGGGAAEHAQLHSLRTQGLSQRMLRVRFCTVRRGSVNMHVWH